MYYFILNVKVTSPLPTALEETRKQCDVLKTENTQLRTNRDALKDEIGQLTTLLNRLNENNLKQIQQINSQNTEIVQLTAEVQKLKVS